MTVEERINELQKQIDELKAETKNKFKRVGVTENYFTVAIERGKAITALSCDVHDDYDDKRFENNNYFLTKERAEEVAKKINALLKFERIYDTLCPEYKPNWYRGDEVKWFVIDNYLENDAYYDARTYYKNPTVTYFPTDKIDEAMKLYKEMP